MLSVYFLTCQKGGMDFIGIQTKQCKEAKNEMPLLYMLEEGKSSTI